MDKPSEKTPGQLAYENYWLVQLPAEIEATGWERLSEEMRAAWEEEAKNE
jgi:hypothetical protein